MKSIKIISITDQGKIALEQCIVEGMKEGKASKMMFKMLGYTQEVVENNPLIVEITLKRKVFQKILKAQDMINKIESIMRENKAIQDIDYKIEVID